jgi:hypothetical protein
MDSELLMKSLNPELYQLMVRVKAIHAICGGDTGIKVRAALVGAAVGVVAPRRLAALLTAPLARPRRPAAGRQEDDEGV